MHQVTIEFRFKNFEAMSNKFEKIPRFDPDWEQHGILSRRQYEKIISMHKDLNRGPKALKSLNPMITPILLIPLGLFTPVLKSASYSRTESNTKRIKNKLRNIGLDDCEFTVSQHLDYCRIPIGYSVIIEGIKVINPPSIPTEDVRSTTAEQQILLPVSETSGNTGGFGFTTGGLTNFIAASSLLVTMVCSTGCTYFAMNAMSSWGEEPQDKECFEEISHSLSLSVCVTDNHTKWTSRSETKWHG